MTTSFIGCVPFLRIFVDGRTTIRLKRFSMKVIGDVTFGHIVIDGHSLELLVVDYDNV